MWKHHLPLDPACPEVEHAFQIEAEPGVWIDDPMGAPVMDELMADFENRHRRNCGRCREYGMMNVEVIGP